MVEFSIREFFFVLLVIPFILCGIAGVWRRVAEWRTEAQMRRSLMRCRYCGAPCLLYTSPSPRDRTRSRMPSSA